MTMTCLTATRTSSTWCLHLALCGGAVVELLTGLSHSGSPDIQAKIRHVIEQGHIDLEEFKGVR